jgi:hypothetical protein
MSHFNIALFSQSLAAEIADMFVGGFEEAGHTAVTQIFTFDPQCLNIVMPAVLFPTDALDQIPRATVFYNTEDLEYQPPAKQAGIIEILRRGFPMWDYSRKNLGWYGAQGFPDHVRHVPLGYAGRLERVISRPWEQRPIDVLFYGRLTQRRVDILSRLMATGLTVGTFANVFGEFRNDLISRAKLVLNVPAMASFVAECPRVTFCAINRKVCVSELPAYPLAPAWREAVTFVPFDEIVATCEALARDRDAVLDGEVRAYQAIRSLPVSASLQAAVAEMPRSAAAP